VVAANPGMAALELDIADPASIDSVAKQLITEHPDVNVLINNAALPTSRALQRERLLSARAAGLHLRGGPSRERSVPLQPHSFATALLTRASRRATTPHE
jgi:NAD(P)-dependent dehydrogenase (short-subunit alcohol dehydrogenase family)